MPKPLFDCHTMHGFNLGHYWVVLFYSNLHLIPYLLVLCGVNALVSNYIIMVMTNIQRAHDFLLSLGYIFTGQSCGSVETSNVNIYKTTENKLNIH